MQFKRILAISICLTTFYCSIYAQETEPIENLITDRPDQTESAVTVPKNHVQIETGAAYQDYGNDTFREQSFTYNTTLLRYGILNTMELRLGWSFTEIETEINQTKTANVLSGFSPLSIGAKIEISEESTWKPKIALLTNLYLPFSASTDYKPETTGVDLFMLFAHTLNESSNLSYNLGASWGNDSPEAIYKYTLSYGHSLTDAIGFYAEVYGQLPEKNKASHFWDAGFTYLITSTIQLDATVGTSFTKGQNLLLSGGISIRLPN
ncbi:transporter [Aquimarina sp. W85]|uniref:transporter n=1 Tax=Aquimarina rhodophyticola TaxID=3342246 RepID=UPI00366D9931